jgi:hypothetical protein
MAGTVDPVTTTTIDHIMAELELLNRHMDHREDLLLSIMVKLGLLPLTPMKMQSSSPRPVPLLVLRPVDVAASLVVEHLPLASPMPEPLLPPIRIGTPPRAAAPSRGRIGAPCACVQTTHVQASTAAAKVGPDLLEGA